MSTNASNRPETPYNQNRTAVNNFLDTDGGSVTMLVVGIGIVVCVILAAIGVF